MPVLRVGSPTAGINISAVSNAPELVAAFGDIARKQIPFATAVSLTRIAQLSKQETILRLTRHFKIRSKRVAAGVRIVRAEKRDWPNCIATVGTLDGFMALQGTGGEKTAQHGHRVAIPSRIAMSKRTSTGAMQKPYKPRSLRAEGGKGFLGADQKTIWLKTDKMRSNLRNLGITRFYRLEKSQRIKKRWPFVEEVRGDVGKVYGLIFQVELEAAIRSRRMQMGSFTSKQGKVAYLKAVQRTTGRI